MDVMLSLSEFYIIICNDSCYGIQEMLDLRYNSQKGISNILDMALR